MPGYEPYLLCDFHVHTTWSDGRLTLREVVDLYGQTEKFDVLAITDHILAKKDLLGRLGRMATLGRRRFSITSEMFDDYMADIEKEGARAKRQYGMVVIPGAEVTQNHIRARHNSHIVALGSEGVHQRRSEGEGNSRGNSPAGRTEHRLPPAPSNDAPDGDRDMLLVGSP